MKRKLLALTGILMLSVPAWAGSPDRVQINKHGGIWEAVITRSTVFASAAIDTVYLDVKDVYQGLSGAAATGATEAFMFADNLAAADSVSLVLAPCAQAVTASCIAASGVTVFTFTGSAPVFEKAIASAPCRFYRCIITNNQHASQAAIDYRLTIQLQQSR